MRIHIIACRIFSRELNWLAAQSENQIDITWVGRGLHNTPDKLRCHLCDTVNDIYRQIEEKELDHRPDYIALAYGLCSGGVVGVECKDIPIIIPRTDDCIALFMGSQEKYMQEFTDAKGAFWLNNGWIEQSLNPLDIELLRRRKWQEYAEKYGEDNADYLIDVESSWISNYSTLGYIHSDAYDSQKYLDHAKNQAENNNWSLREIKGDLRLLRMLVDGNWNDREFLILKKGEKVAPDYTGAKIKAVLNEENE